MITWFGTNLPQNYVWLYKINTYYLKDAIIPYDNSKYTAKAKNISLQNDVFHILDLLNLFVFFHFLYIHYTTIQAIMQEKITENNYCFSSTLISNLILS